MFENTSHIIHIATWHVSASKASNARGLQEAECTWDPRLRRLEKLPIVAKAIDKH